MSGDLFFHPPFPDIYDQEELTALLEQLGSEESIPKGTCLCRADQPKLPDVILLKSGSVKACQTSSSGGEQIYNIFRSGSHLFLLSAVTGRSPALDFIASSPCRLVRVPLDTVCQAILDDGRLVRTLLVEFGARLTFSYRRMRECESYSTEWKLCNMLLSLAERSGEEHAGKIMIRERLSQQTMAGMLRSSRITVARTLKALRDAGLIETVNGYLCIRDEAALIEHMHYISIPLE